jgi:Tfp pilus assembly protein PilF
MPKFFFPHGHEDVITDLLDKQFGPGRARLESMSFARSDATEEFHQTQLREKPSDPNTHSNYGAFLKDVTKDQKGAEREYRKALELDTNHVNALGNLANLLSEKGDQIEATTLYEKALRIDPGNENVSLNYARFSLRDAEHFPQALKVLEKGIATHPNSGRLILFRAEVRHKEGALLESLVDYRTAREKGADQARVEVGYSCALQMSGAPVGECIAAYRTAIALNPDNAALRLNLAQLLFIKPVSGEAKNCKKPSP